MVKKFKSSFKARLMTLAILPVLFVATALTFVVGIRLQAIMSDNTIHELQGAAYGLREMIATISPDEFSVDADGVMYAGDKDLTYLNGVFDEFTKESGMYATLFFGDTRRNTSVVNNGQRAVGTQCTDAVKAAVLQKGQEFTSMSTQVAGKECVVAYVPLYQPGTKNVCGMVFTGISKENFKKSINSAISYVLAVAIFATAATIAIAVLVSSKMNAALVGASKVCNDLADGDFTGEKTSAGGSRADELGRMVNSVNEMKERFDTTISGVKNNIDTLVVSAKGLDKAANE
ncbi:MAG: methyl-accepting chemotaxis protein, partial [Lachnospiraceae bacterium]|nr:methyl-accepting chemotaxis protein [Lachnospiraceae bacterium]